MEDQDESDQPSQISERNHIPEKIYIFEEWNTVFQQYQSEDEQSSAINQMVQEEEECELSQKNCDSIENQVGDSSNLDLNDLSQQNWIPTIEANEVNMDYPKKEQEQLNTVQQINQSYVIIIENIPEAAQEEAISYQPQTITLIKNKTIRKDNRTRNIPKLYGGYFMRNWKNKIGNEYLKYLPKIQEILTDETKKSKSKTPKNAKNAKNAKNVNNGKTTMTPKSMNKINMLREIISFKEESLKYIEHNDLLFEILNSTKIQDIKPCLEVMKQYYYSLKNDKNIENQTTPKKKTKQR